MVTTSCFPLLYQLSIISVPAFTSPKSLSACPTPDLPTSIRMEQRVQHPCRELMSCLPGGCSKGTAVRS